MQEHQNEAGAQPPSKTPPSVYNASVGSPNGKSNHEFSPSLPADWAEPDDEIGRMFGRYSQYSNWNENDNRKGRAPWDRIRERLAGVTRGRHARNLTGSTMDDWEPGDFDGVLMPTGKGVGRVILKPDQDNEVYHAKVGDPNYAEAEEAKFRRAHRAAYKPSESRISLQRALAEARELERKYEPRHKEGCIPNSEHAELCGDLAGQLRCLAKRVENVPDASKKEVLRALLSEMRKGYGIKGHTTSNGDTMISMQAHNEVMRGICQRTIKLIEALSELQKNGGNGSNETDGAEHHN